VDRVSLVDFDRFDELTVKTDNGLVEGQNGVAGGLTDGQGDRALEAERLVDDLVEVGKGVELLAEELGPIPLQYTLNLQARLVAVDRLKLVTKALLNVLHLGKAPKAPHEGGSCGLVAREEDSRDLVHNILVAHALVIAEIGGHVRLDKQSNNVLADIG
jgi:hypothetical protein